MGETPSTVVIAFGNSLRGDDGVGPLVGEMIAAAGLPHVQVVSNIGDGARAVEAWANARTAYLVDSANSGAAPGTIHRFDGLAEPIPESFFRVCSTHCFGVSTSIELGRALGRLPDRLIVYGIEGENFSFGPAISDCVREAARCLVDRLLGEWGLEPG